MKGLSSFKWLAPAKVNLTLRVLGKRDDGFHALDSLMVPLDLSDFITFEKAEKYSLVCDSPGVPVDESNLVSKAVRVFQNHTGADCAWRVSLQKNVPHGAGLGGGSSDAATMLLALNELEKTELSRELLVEMASEIGSDIPFFIFGQPCKIEGRGEIVRPVDPSLQEKLRGVSFLLLKPQFGVNTPEAYRHWADAEEVYGVDYAPQQMLWGEMVNDLEKPVFQKHRFLAEMKMWLLAQPEISVAMMSGSGSTMMAFFNPLVMTHSEKEVDILNQILARAKKELDPTLWGACVKVV